MFLYCYIALKFINSNTGNDLQVYTNGNKDVRDCSGNGVFFKDPNYDINIKMRNPDSCPFFRRSF